MFPLQVAPGQETLFSYFLRPATTRDGFDQIAIEATTAPRFDAFLEDSQKAQTRQLVDPGDAAPQVESSSNVVRLPIADQLFASLSFSPARITPNGDGINDQLRISFDLINVLSDRPLHLRLYDLSGRPLFSQERASQAGHIAWQWDGRDLHGQRVPPGLYIAELHIAGDAGDRSVRRIVAVAY